MVEVTQNQNQVVDNSTKKRHNWFNILIYVFVAVFSLSIIVFYLMQLNLWNTSFVASNGQNVSHKTNLSGAICKGVYNSYIDNPTCRLAMDTERNVTSLIILSGIFTLILVGVKIAIDLFKKEKYIEQKSTNCSNKSLFIIGKILKIVGGLGSLICIILVIFLIVAIIMSGEGQGNPAMIVLIATIPFLIFFFLGNYLEKKYR